MSEWITPKTDWHYSIDKNNGNYSGDYFNFSDYNRIKNNIAYLREMAIVVYPDFEIKSLEDKGYSDFPYADEINVIENNLHALNLATWNDDYGETKTYYPNAEFIDFNELNRLESATLSIYKKMMNRLEHRRMLGQHFEKGGMSWL